jgi:hypothetical protein
MLQQLRARLGVAIGATALEIFGALPSRPATALGELLLGVRRRRIDLGSVGRVGLGVARNAGAEMAGARAALATRRTRARRVAGRVVRLLSQQPAAVDDEVDAVDAAVREQEVDGTDDVLGRREAPARRALLDVGDRFLLVFPSRRIRDDAGMDRVEPTGASSTASVRIKLLTAPLTVVIEVEPG